jgi:hypothetical protein
MATSAGMLPVTNHLMYYIYIYIYIYFFICRRDCSPHVLYVYIYKIKKLIENTKIHLSKALESYLFLTNQSAFSRARASGCRGPERARCFRFRIRDVDAVRVKLFYRCMLSKTGGRLGKETDANV